MDILITGGCGFVGSYLAKLWKNNNLKNKITVFDNLKRNGSELNLPIFKKLGVDFIHGDIRNLSDFESIGKKFDLILDASAVPSVNAETDMAYPRYLLDTNLNGTINCLEFAKKNCGGMIFLSTSRVYPIAPLRNLKCEEGPTRFNFTPDIPFQGISYEGINENFPVFGHGFRSLYGTTKLASELICEEYVANYNIPIVINRCGVIAGAGQFGKVDQGIFTLWAARHFYGGDLFYKGFGGTGKQVRDILHPTDLFCLIEKQIAQIEKLKGEIFSIGGGISGSVSLLEYTLLCQSYFGKSLNIKSQPNTSKVDLPWIVMDNSKAKQYLDWEPKVKPNLIVEEIGSWLKDNQEELKLLFS